MGQSTLGEILGVVKDPSQGAVPGAQAILTNVEQRTEYSASTDAVGGFHFVNLKPGRP